MANIIGPKGQVVIRKEIRDRLGLGPGWKATQRIVDDHVELHFIPPTHNRSLAGILKPFIDPTRAVPTDEEIDDAIEAGFADDLSEEEKQICDDWTKGRREIPEE